MSLRSFFNQFPYTDFHELNLDFLLGKCGEIDKAVKESKEAQEGAETAKAGAEAAQTAAETALDNIGDSLERAEGFADAASESATAAAGSAEIAKNYAENISGPVGSIVSDWLQEHITENPSVVIDTSLSVTGAAADAAATGLAKNAVIGIAKAASDKNLNIDYAYISNRSRVSNGVTWKSKDGVVNVVGTSTGLSFFDIFTSTDAASFPFLPGKSYVMKYNTNIPCYTSIEYTRNGSTSVQYRRSLASDCVVFVLPESFDSFMVRLFVESAGVAATGTYNFSIWGSTDNGAGPFDQTLISAFNHGEIDFSAFFQHKNSASKNYYGVDFSESGNSISINGTATHTGQYTLINDITKSFFKAGDRVKINYTCPQNNVYVECVAQSSGGNTVLLQTMDSGEYHIIIPETFDSVRLNLLVFNGTTYNTTVKVDVTSDRPDVLIVAKDGTGHFSQLKPAVEEAVKRYGTTVIVKPGKYDMVAEYGKSYLDGLSASNNDYGLMLYNDVVLRFAPSAYVSFDYDGTNTWIIQNFSLFNTGNKYGFTIEGLKCSVRNCKYLLHDDPRPGNKSGYSRNIIRNCILATYPSTNYPDWVNHQVIGGGLGDSTSVIIENCFFNNHTTVPYNAVSYHNSTSGSSAYESSITVMGCIFADNNRLEFDAYGDADEKTIIKIHGNSFKNTNTDIVYKPGTSDNMTILRWGNESR